MSTRQGVGALVIEVPDDWRRSESVSLVKPGKGDAFRANLSITSSPARGLDVRAAAHQARMALIKLGLPGLRFIGESEAQVGGHTGLKLEFTHSFSVVVDGKERASDLRRALVILVIGERVFEVTSAATVEAADDWVELERALASATLA